MSHPHPDLAPPARLVRNGLRIVALGGIGEIGRNMTVFEYRGRLLVVDCGVLARIAAALRGSPVVHFDETGFRVDGALAWVTPIMLSRVTSWASSASLKRSVWSGRSGSTR